MRIEKIDVVGAYRVDPSAPLKLGVALAEVAEKNSVAVTPLSVDAVAPPQIPRFMVGVPNCIVQVALDRIQASIVPPEHIQESPDEIFAFVGREIERLLFPLLNQSWMVDQWAGAILEIVFPISESNAIEAAGKVASSITNLSWATGNLKSFQLQIGRQQGAFNQTVTIAGYEKRRANVTLKPGTNFINLRDVDSTVDEGGILITLDVNNRAEPDRPQGSSGIESVLTELRRVLSNLPEELNIGGVL